MDAGLRPVVTDLGGPCFMVMVVVKVRVRVRVTRLGVRGLGVRVKG